MEWKIKQKINLSKSNKCPLVWANSVMVPGDNAAHIWEVEITNDGVAVPLTGFTVTGYFVKSDNTTVTVTGSVSGNIARVTLTPACYTMPGILRGVMKVTSGTTVMTASEAYFTVKAGFPV